MGQDSRDGRVPDGTGLSQAEPQEGLGPSGFDPSRLALVLDPVAEAIHASIFEEPLGPTGTIERALYRQAAEAGLRAGVTVYRTASPRCEHCGDQGDIHRADGEWLGVCDCPAADGIKARLFEQGAERINELRAHRDELRRVLENVLKVFCDPMTRRALGGHSEGQQCAVLEAREVLRRPL